MFQFQRICQLQYFFQIKDFCDEMLQLFILKIKIFIVKKIFSLILQQHVYNLFTWRQCHHSKLWSSSFVLENYTFHKWVRLSENLPEIVVIIKMLRRCFTVIEKSIRSTPTSILSWSFQMPISLRKAQNHTSKRCTDILIGDEIIDVSSPAISHKQ